MILVCCHKKSDLYNSVTHVPIHVGALNSGENFGFLRDDDGENISDMNNSFCELTALYWAWKNCDDINDKIWGLEHYRRYFGKRCLLSTVIYQSFNSFKPLSKRKIELYLEKYDIIMARREVYPVRLYSDYAMKHERKDMDILREVIREKSPEFLSAFNDIIYNNNKLSPYNMFISSKSFLNEYCEWLFMILFEVNKRIDLSSYDSYQRRVFGFMSERLLNVFVKHKKLDVLYLPIVVLDNKPSLIVRIAKINLYIIDTLRFLIIKQKRIE